MTSIDEIIKARKIEHILHFTTTSGLLGILATWSVKSRHRLPKEKYLEHVYKPNCQIRRDGAWIDYVNLSIQAINSQFFDICANKWHKDKEWCVLSFDPVILTHKGVVFATTNNMYSGVKRATGADGLNALYAPKIERWAGTFVVRTSSHAPSQPTDNQAEALYPCELSLDYLNNVFLSTDEQTDILAGQIAVLNLAVNINYEVYQAIFE